MARQMKGGWTVAEEEPLKTSEEIAMPEIGAMLLLRARQFKNNPHSALKGGDVFVSRLDTHGGTWTVGETDTEESDSQSAVVVTHDANDFQARSARYELDRLQKSLANTVRAIQSANRDAREVPQDWKDIYEAQKAEIARLEAVVASKTVTRWVFKNTDPLPPMRLV